MNDQDGEIVTVAAGPWRASWEPDDPHGNFKQDVADYTRLDCATTLRRLAHETGVPVEAIARYVLSKWCAEGSDALLALGPRTVERMWSVVEVAEQAGTVDARLDAYDRLRAMVSWLRSGLDQA